MSELNFHWDFTTILVSWYYEDLEILYYNMSEAISISISDLLNSVIQPLHHGTQEDQQGAAGPGP